MYADDESNFRLSEDIIILSSFFKAIFVGYKILD